MRETIRRAALAAVLMVAANSHSEPIARFEIRPRTPVLTVPLSIDLDSLPPIEDGLEPVLCRVEGPSRTPLACQVESARLWFQLDRPVRPGQAVTLELTAEKPRQITPVNIAVMDDKQITLSRDGRNIISYHHAVCPVPEGVDPVYQRSGFLHPLTSPAGRVLTRIQPPDHWHHYGLWNAWTKTVIEGREVDFWNLQRQLGTVRFAGLVSQTSGPIWAGFAAKQDHIVFEPNGQEKTAIREVLEVRTSACEIGKQTVWIVDHTCTFSNVLDSDIELALYRYGGGICLRAPATWTKETCTILTSEGKTRDEADGTRARWTDVRGPDEDGQLSGILFLSHRDNPRHPEPLRVWPSDANGGRGDLMFNITPTRQENWILKPGREHVLRYRLVVYDGNISPESAQTLWENFAEPPVVSIQP